MLKKASLALAAAAALSVNAAHAGQLDSSSFTVQATIAGSCTAITPQSLFDFGTITGTAANTDSSMTVSVTCTTSLPYNLTMGYGTNGNSAGRKMANGANTLNYQLFTDSGRTINFDDFGGNASGWIGGIGTGSSQSILVYGRVPVQSTPPAGVYTDSVIAAVVW